MRLRAGMVIGGTIGLVLAMLALVLRVLMGGAAPPVAAPPPVHAPLTSHLAFVVVDGLAYDIATDPTRMPRFAAAMRTHSSGEMWAGPVSMTSSAVLAFGTGRPGGLDRIIGNEMAREAPFAHLPGAARTAGRTTAAVGDVAWFSLYREGWTLARPDPTGVAIDADYTEKTFADVRELAATRPNLLVAHFVVPDHQGHAYGVASSRYRDYIRRFDAELDRWLGELPPDTTVIVTSDHGANEAGKHGSDSPVQRRCPFYAHGPGIVTGHHPAQRLSQLDVPATLSYLLGVPAPAHGLGHVLADWLDAPEADRLAAERASVARLHALAQATLPSVRSEDASTSCVAESPSDGASTCRAAAAMLATEIEGHTPAAGGDKWWWLAFAALLALGLVRVAWPTLALRRPWLTGSAVGAIAVTSVLVVRHLERLPHGVGRPMLAALCVAGGTAMLVATLRAKALAARLERHPWLAVLPLALFVSTYTMYTQPFGYAFVLVVALVLLVDPVRRRFGWTGRATGRSAHPLLAIALAWPIGLRGEELIAASWTPRMPWIAAVSVLVVAVDRVAQRRGLDSARQRTGFACVTLLALAAVLWRTRLPAPIGACLWLGGPIAAWWAARAGHRATASMGLLAVLALLARPADLALAVPTLLVAEHVGEALSAALTRDGRAGPPVIAVGVAFLFALLFVQRIGLGAGVDFTNIDWGAGTFGGGKGSYPLIVAANLSKHLLGAGWIVAGVLAPLTPSNRLSLARGLLAMELARSVVLAAMLFACRESHWTAMRVMSDLPHAWIASVVAAVACALVLVGVDGGRERGDSWWAMKDLNLQPMD